MRTFIARQPKLALGVKIALTFMAQKAAAVPVVAGTAPSGVADTALFLTQGTVRKMLNSRLRDLSWLDIANISTSNTAVAANRYNFPMVTTGTAVCPPGAESVNCRPLTYEEARLWLQSYNAGPYATLKYKGKVPYRETRDYVPRIMKYYAMDLKDTPYDAYIVQSAAKYGLDPQMIRAIMKAESDFKRGEVSSAGARGLMQVMPCVWQEVRQRYHLDWNYSGEVFDPEKNVEVACAYLAWLRYDFLPQHFADFDVNPEAPAAVKRDRLAKSSADRILVGTPPVPVKGANGVTVAAAAGEGQAKPKRSRRYRHVRRDDEDDDS